MKITGVSVTLYGSDSSRLRGDAHCADGRGMGCLVELSTDERLTGIAIGGGNASCAIGRLVDQVLAGQDPRGVTGLWQRMTEIVARRGARGPIVEAAAVLDNALWDLKARANREPLWKTLGSSRPRVNVYASDAAQPLEDAAGLRRWYAEMAGRYGIWQGKLKAGTDPDADLQRLGAMRDALRTLTDEPTLMVDADEAWSPKEAIRRVREMEAEFDLTWAEAPAPRHDFDGLRHVSDRIRAAVCAGRHLGTAAEFLPLFRHRSIDIVQLDPARCGITAALQLADAAFGYELPVTLAASPGNVHAHLAGAMPYFMSLEVIDPHPGEAFLGTGVRIEGGRAVAGDADGNGLVIDHEALAAVAVDALPRTDAPVRSGPWRGGGEKT